MHSILLKPSDLTLAFSQLQACDASYVFPVCVFPSPPERGLRLNTKMETKSVDASYAWTRTKTLKTCFMMLDNFTVVGPHSLTKLNYITNKAIILPSWRAVDIDTDNDWTQAEQAHKLLSNLGVNMVQCFKKFEFLEIKSGHVLNAIILSVLAALSESFGLALILPILDFLQKGENVSDLVNKSQFGHTYFIFSHSSRSRSLCIAAAFSDTTIYDALGHSLCEKPATRTSNSTCLIAHEPMSYHHICSCNLASFSESTSSLINILANELPRATGNFMYCFSCFQI